MKSRRTSRSAGAALATALALSLAVSLGGCEAVFTTSLFSFLQRDPANLSAEQQIAWAEQALASGDPEAMAEAYELVKDRATGSSDPELTYLAGRLALELSGASALLTATLDGSADFTVAVDVERIFAELNTSYLAEAGDFYQATHANDGTYLAGTDFVLGCICLLFEAVDAHSGDANGANYGQVNAFALAGQTAVGTEDAAYDILDALRTLNIP